MKQVTGATNNKPEIKNVSIRLRLDGHSFSEEKLDMPAKEKKTVEIEVLTGKTMTGSPGSRSTRRPLPP